MKKPLLTIAFVGVAASLLAGCATPESRVRDKLVAAGVKPPMAACLADKLVHKLSYAELKELARVANMPSDHPGHLSFGELSERLAALNNPHIVHVVTRAGLGCAIAG